MKDFDNKVAAITGAASGIGRALAIELAGRGCQVALADIDEAGLKETAERARRRGVEVSTQHLDVAERQAMEAWADRVATEHGRVNLIFNNAGVAIGSTVAGMEYHDLEWLMGINFWGVVYGTKAFLPHLVAAGEGHVVNISSVFGLVGIPTQSAYNASKFAVRGFTESLRLELDAAHNGVSATTIHPGGIKTNIARNARMSHSLHELGMDPQQAIKDFERLFFTKPETAARVILGAVERNRRRAMIGPDAHVFNAMAHLPPGVYQRIIGLGTRRGL